ncbi:IS4 family transposase [Stenotrophomonas sp. NPDC077659]|uniref:IS4 family transposase n=1 Tax=Stenotrophomonas sp. NPDC077659 TaxID=3390694 RepID=UPI003D04E491
MIVVGWCRLKGDGKWHLLRAAVPVGGRTLPLFEQVFPERELASPRVECQFLKRLKMLLPADACPILVTDAGFRAPWCRSVEAMGWTWITRLRHHTRVKPVEIEDRADQWVPCHALYPLAVVGKTHDLGLFQIVRSAPLTARLVLHAARPRGRRHTTLKGQRRRSRQSRKNACREAEPWLLMASPTMGEVDARQIVALYRRRMQIELGFRDLKSHRYGQAFEDSLTRKRERMEVLLLLHALAMFVRWLAGMAAESIHAHNRLNPHRSTRRLYCLIRLGWEALTRRWLDKPRVAMLDALHTLSPEAKQNMASRI